MSDNSRKAPPTTAGEAPARPPLAARLAARLHLPWFGRGAEASLRESLEEAIGEHEADDSEPIRDDERLMLLNILSLDERSADDVMVPRADIVAVEIDTPFDRVVQIFRDAHHSRMPVFRDSLDDVLGMVHIKDILKALADADGGAEIRLATIIRRPIFVPPSMPVLDLLAKMRATRTHMAVVVDEYGGTDGLVTIEDLVEEIVGEIEDEHDKAREPEIIQCPDGRIEADARASVEALEKVIEADFLPAERDEDIDTIGGLVVSLVGRVPDRGEVVCHPDGFEFEVIDADPRHIKRLRIRCPAVDDNPSGDETQ